MLKNLKTWFHKLLDPPTKVNHRAKHHKSQARQVSTKRAK